jgi:hypothetical protein
MADTLVAYKMRALGISEAFLSGDASYAAAESAYSTFLESMAAYRSHLTSQIFYRRIFPLVAVVNGLYRDASRAKHTSNPLDFLFNANNSANLKIPQVHWHKGLEAKTEDSMFDLLEKASDKGVPIPLKMWMAAANIDPDNLTRDLATDKDFTERLNKLKGEVETQTPEGAEDFDEQLEAQLHRITSASLNSGYKISKPLADREFHSHEMTARTRTGKLKVVYGQKAKLTDLNAKIVKIAARAQKDPEYRRQLAKRNMEKLGRSTLPL